MALDGADLQLCVRCSLPMDPTVVTRFSVPSSGYKDLRDKFPVLCKKAGMEKDPEILRPADMLVHGILAFAASSFCWFASPSLIYEEGARKS